MTPKKTTTKLAAVLLAVIMAMQIFCLGAAAADESGAKTITVMISDEAVIMPPTEISVSPDEAAKYGYPDDPTTVSVFDAMTAAHKYLLGGDFTADTAKNYLNITESGFVDLILGDNRASGFLTDGIQPNDGVLNPLYGSYGAYTADKAYLNGGETIDIFFYQDQDFYSDYYSVFDRSEITAAPGEKITLSLSGYMTFYGAYPADMIEESTEPLADIAILSGTDENNLSASGITTDENGAFSIGFDEPGTYYISAESASDGFTYFIPPWCRVTVADNRATAEPSETPSAAPSAEPSKAPSEDIETKDRIPILLENISRSYADTSDPWALFDMARGGYEKTLTDKAASLQKLTDEAYSADTIGAVSKYGLAIGALGGNLKKLTTSDGGQFDLIDKLSSFETSDISYITDAVFAMTVYDSGNYAVGGNLTREALLDYILTSRNSDGIWGYEWGGQSFPDYDSTAMALNALAKYYSASSAKAAGLDEETYGQIKSAVSDIINILSAAQSESGTFYSSNTDAMAVIGLAAVGIDPSSDARFVKGGSAIDGLTGYALGDNSGFGFSDNSEFNALATEQSFRALIAYSAFKNGGNKPFNIYTDKITAPSGSGGGSSSGGGSGSGGFDSGKITVYVTLKGDTVHGSGKHSGGYPTWIAETATTVSKGGKASDAVKAALSAKGYTADGIDSGYIRSVTAPDGVKLSEFDNGKNSGWLYTVNGVSPSVGISSYTVKDGDRVVLYYSDDYTKESGSSGGWSGGGSFEGSSTQSTAAPTPTQAPIETPSSAPSSSDFAEKSGFTDVSAEHWAYDYIMKLSAGGILSGYPDGSFMPDGNITRAELTAVLCRAFGNGTAAEYQNGLFSDVSADDWHSGYIAWASSVGFVNGYPDGSFLPDSDITREDICVILARICAVLGKDGGARPGEPFADQNEISDYAADGVLKMRCMGIVGGKENNMFEPKAPATRAEAAKMICGLL